MKKIIVLTLFLFVIGVVLCYAEVPASCTLVAEPLAQEQKDVLKPQYSAQVQEHIANSDTSKIMGTADQMRQQGFTDQEIRAAFGNTAGGRGWYTTYKTYLTTKGVKEEPTPLQSAGRFISKFIPGGSTTDTAGKAFNVDPSSDFGISLQTALGGS